MKRTFSGPATGPGAIYAWEGDKNVGTGRIEITEVVAERAARLQPRHAQAVRGAQQGRVHA